MAGAVTHTWPKDVRAQIVSAVLDQGMSQGKALRAAAAGELDGVPARAPGRSTLAGWVQQEQNKRNREARAKVANGGLPRLAEEALARALTPVFEDCQRIEAGRPSKLTKRTAEAIVRNVDVLRRACPSVGKELQRRPEPNGNGTNGTQTESDGTKASTLAERLAARASRPPKAKNTQRETAPAHTTQDHAHSTEQGESDSVERAPDRTAALAGA